MKRGEKPDLWSAEIPNLYTLTIECFDQNGERSELVSQRIGFRRFEMKDGIMTLNGKRIVFKGVNRHEFSSKTGRAVTKGRGFKRHRYDETEQHQCDPHLPLPGCFHYI